MEGSHLTPRIVSFLIVASLWLAGCVSLGASITRWSVPTATPATETALAVSPEVIERGIAVYRQNYCGVCHKLMAANTAGVFGPGHDDMGSLAKDRIHAADYKGTATTAAEYIYESIVDPTAYIVEGYAVTHHPMPPFAHLSKGDLHALVQVLLAQHE